MQRNVYTIPPHLPFLDSLAEGLVRQHGKDPLLFSRMTILLPSRRACKAMGEAFLRVSGGKPLLLPAIHPLGENDEDAQAFKLPGENNGTAIPNLLSGIGQQLALTQLIKRWQSLLEKGGSISTPQAAHLAAQLGSFLGEVQKEQLSFKDIASIVPAELARHWQVTLDFLSILMEKWPDYLKEHKAVDIHTQRNLALSDQAQYWRKNPSPYPVIAAGSTGSIPATAELLEVIARMPHGSVILPGLDTVMSNTSWKALEPTHPQYGLRQLLERMRTTREEVKPWGKFPFSGINRTSLVSQVMLPSATVSDWRSMESIEKRQLEGIEYITTSGLQEEASVIALQMKKTLEVPGKTAALITHERDLARRVAATLRRWNITIDDSAGSPLANTPPAVFLRLLADMAVSLTKSPVAMLQCLKHPLCSGGMDSGTFRHYVRALELACMRGVRSEDGLRGMFAQLKESGQSRLIEWLKSLEVALVPLLKNMQRPSLSFADTLKAHITAAEYLTADAHYTGAERLWKGAAGEALKTFLDELLEAAQSFPAIDPGEYAGLLEALLAGQTFRPTYGTHPRLFIISPIEARMLRFDRIILGGLNEGSWPPATKADPWMSRPMRASFGLSLPEKKIGQAAHDFATLLCSPQVVLTRSEKIDGTQTIPSRWLLRLDAITSILQAEKALAAKEPWLQWASLLHKPETVKPCQPPAPKPPREARPKTLSATNIETLMRDPYAIYARKILELKALDPIDKDPGAQEFGNFVHDALEAFLKRYSEAVPQDPYALLLETGKATLQARSISPAVVAFWWPRFERIAGWFAQNEPLRRASGTRILSEAKGQYRLDHAGAKFIVEARADRIEVDIHNNLTIVDYKTGTPPTATDIRLGYSAQMTIEGMIANQGGYGVDGTTRALEHWKLSGGEAPVTIQPIKEPEVLILEAEESLRKLIALFDDPSTPYLASPDPTRTPRYNDYEHLERVKEWSE